MRRPELEGLGTVTADASAAETKPERRRWISIALSFPVAFLWTLGLLVRVTVQDRLQPIAVVYYALPLPVLVLLGFLLTFFFGRMRQKKMACWLLLISLLQAGYWLSGSYGSKQPQTTQPGLRIAFWNVCRGYLGHEAIGRELRATNADIIAIVEAGPEGEDAALWERLCPGYRATRLGSDMIVLVRGSLREFEAGQHSDMLRYRVCRLRVRSPSSTSNELPLTLIVADIASAPRRSRKKSFEVLDGVVRGLDDDAVILCGDFNTPPDSVHFSGLRSILSNSHEVAGEGLRETWPVILPVLALDQIWGNQKIEWERSCSGWSVRSDHRPVIAEFHVLD